MPDVLRCNLLPYINLGGKALLNDFVGKRMIGGVARFG
jgi:hypothetical protein